jgi:serine/threonine protein kinase
MAALRSPFFGEKNNVESLVQKIQQSEYPPLPQDCYSPQLERLIAVCMCPEMDKRPSAKEINRVAVYMNTQYSLLKNPKPSPYIIHKPKPNPYLVHHFN